jgi:energy-coupling factor transporter ATP-binding protein EcfA2
VIREIEIEGFKSIERLKLELGRVTVLIGENGCGKSNILEAIAFASAAYEERLAHEFLASRGIRSTAPTLMRPAFPSSTAGQMRVKVSAFGRHPIECLFTEETSTTTPGWSAKIALPAQDGTAEPANIEIAAVALSLGEDMRKIFESIRAERPEKAMLVDELIELMARRKVLEPFVRDFVGFVVFAPENSALRTFEREGQILPMGIKGEGLFPHLRALEQAGKTEVLAELNRRLQLIDWFSGFEIPTDLGPGEHRLSIRDRYLPEIMLDQRSANEGFLFLLFYYTLLLSPDASKFFAIDNIDVSLNPRLCARLMKDVVELAKAQDKQVVVTTHNPAVLDGLNLADDEQRLVVVSRTQRGTTRVGRIPAPRPVQGAPLQRLSEAFIRGFLGGLPDNF